METVIIEWNFSGISAGNRQPQTPKGALNYRSHVEPVETYSLTLRQAQCDKPLKPL